ncbi:2-(1,2-epoxy-1,2-dihydrophenyl)acetyl-CoA isomerase [Pseudonocardia sulfidoxydans NBRC 16205]|uniref:2-(1,2-epoxy-1,2-dihydrophenyl)acetyl-CoA isomerase n=1 Tax=Pseudonocardia sulfidoxydans NBRC 16205 TaxID=1223511 RepID=A0A511DE70_9PSEU|nr:enoyl-CoA hydratase-related protein [Pseudonocardia sulfidoxydans]GEL23072.1 2-(1,2-epoxy-1,2-dihydrophenyl)acetyl-CoA isomerase [Pseudonocardia sulfidoxydans NBRC 16205]
MSELHAEHEGDVLVLTLSRADRRNALTVGLVAALAETIATAPDAGARAVVLTGAPPAFCAGGDLTELSGIAALGAMAVGETIYTRFHDLVRTITTVPVPVIAAVAGPALGAGLDLAAVCDLRIAGASATFASSWIGVGLVPGMGGALWLTRLLGGARAAELVLTGRRIDAGTAERWNLVNEVVPDGAERVRATEWARELAVLPPVALARSKQALRRALTDGADAELAALGSIQASLLTGPEFDERTARFRN